MIKLALVLTHNKTDAENQAQIEFLKPLIEKQTVLNDEFDENGTVVGQFETYYYTLKGLVLPHELRVYQVVPYQPDNKSNPYIAILPANFHDIDAHNVQYGKGDEDKVGDHPRFFNWGLKRGTDYGADIAVSLDNYKKVNIDDLSVFLNTLADPEDLLEFVENQSVKIGTLKLLKEVGQLKEDRPLTQAITDLKQRVTEKGLKNG